MSFMFGIMQLPLLSSKMEERAKQIHWKFNNGQIRTNIVDKLEKINMLQVLYMCLDIAL